MKQIKLLIELIDIFFKLFILGIALALGLIVSDAFSFEVQMGSGANVNQYVFWLSQFIDVVVLILFLISIYYLRKVARNLLQGKPFTVPVIKSLKESGKYMIAAGVLNVLNSLSIFVYKLTAGGLEFRLDVQNLQPLFIIIIGLFLVIQSKVLLTAKQNREELDLVV